MGGVSLKWQNFHFGVNYPFNSFKNILLFIKTLFLACSVISDVIAIILILYKRGKKLWKHIKFHSIFVQIAFSPQNGSKAYTLHRQNILSKTADWFYQVVH